jgi:folate-binding protein YgfZ
MTAHKVTLKKLLRRHIVARGPDALHFLNGMLTADVKRGVVGSVSEQLVKKITLNDSQSVVGSTGISYLLNSKGKAISELRFFVKSKDELCLSVPTSEFDQVYQALDHYKVADNFEWDFNSMQSPEVWSVFDSNLNPHALSLEIVSSVPSAKDRVFLALGDVWGYRMPDLRLGSHHEEWWVQDLSALKNIEGVEIAEEQYKKIRIAHGVPEWGKDILVDSLPLEFPLTDMISFAKGCYIGQEVVARATYRGQMPRGFCRFESVFPLAEDFLFLESDAEKPVGKITTAHGAQGLGLLRFSVLNEGVEKIFQKSSDGNRVYLSKVERLLPEKFGQV